MRICFFTKILTFYLMFGGQLATAQQASLFNQGGATQSGYYAEILFEWQYEKVFVEVMINGKPRKFLVDTGAPLIFSQHLADELGLEPMQHIPVSDIHNKEDSMAVVMAPGLLLGGVEFAGVPALVLANDNMFIDCFELDGFIGSNLLRNSVVQFRLDDRVMVLTDEVGRLGLAPEQAGELMLDRQSGPVMTIRLGKKQKFQLLFDSGSDNLLSMSDRQFQYFQRKKLLVVVDKGHGSGGMGIWGAEPPVAKYRVMIPQFSMGGGNFSKVITQTQAQSNSRIGAGILPYGVLTIDYSGRKYYFTPKTAWQEPESKSRGITAVIDDGKLVVGEVWGQYAGLAETGERIVAVNGFDTANLTVCKVFEENLFRERETLVFTLLNQAGETREVEVGIDTYWVPAKR